MREIETRVSRPSVPTLSSIIVCTAVLSFTSTSHRAAMRLVSTFAAASAAALAPDTAASALERALSARRSANVVASSSAFREGSAAPESWLLEACCSSNT